MRPGRLLARVAMLALAALFGCCPGASAAGVRLTGLAPVVPGAHVQKAATVAARIRAAKGRVRGVSLTPSRTEPYWSCPESVCDEIIDPPPLVASVDGRREFLSPGKKAYEGSGEKGGLAPSDLVSAYKIPTSGGEGETVAVVDAYGFSEAEEDLATYRSEYKLPACTKADGCFHQVNQKGEEANLPPNEKGWDGEQSLDIDMVSAACPACHILLVDANDAYFRDLEEGVDTAARMGAVAISNSYGSPEKLCGEEEGCEERLAAYDHPGVMITVSSGDDGYDNVEEGAEVPSFPANLGTVVAVGGTNLRKADNGRGWEDTVWDKSGSGCSLEQPKPPWQHDTSCATRMDNDIAAVASCETPVSVYGSFREGWELVCGTSVSSPLVAGIEAHASSYARALPGADAFYQDPGAAFDVTAGSNGTCTPPEEHAYYCHAEAGYDGPTGNGTPDGPLLLSGAPPAVRTSEPSGVSGTAATLSGSIDAQGVQASYQFEYGTSTAYGTTVPVPAGTIEASYEGQRVSASIGGLQAGVIYHFRLSARNAAGTSHGADIAFVTAPPSVTAVSPDEGPAHGGTSVTISGANLLGATAVKFGGRSAYFHATSNESISAQAPTGSGSVPVTVTTPAGSSEAAPAASYTYEPAGAVLAWGLNHDGLGDGLATDSDVPVEVLGVPEAVGLAAGSESNLALLPGGRVAAWGENTWGSVGDGTNIATSVPVLVCAVGPEKETCPDGPYLGGVTAVAAGEFGSLALLDDGKVVAWGSGEYLGRGPRTSESRRPAYVCDTPKASEPDGLCKPGEYLTEVVGIAAGAEFNLALLRNGTVVGWGRDSEGELGTGSNAPEDCGTAEKPEGCATYPVPVPHLSEVTAISAGNDHALALLKDGEVMAWGADEQGELGNGTSEAIGTPAPVCASGETHPCAHSLEGVSAIAAGDWFSVAALSDGSVLTWGSNEAGALGDGSSTGPESCGEESCSRTPLEVPGLHEVRLIATGEFAGDETVAVTDSGEVLSWGNGDFGRLGDGNWFVQPSPTRVCAAYAETPCSAFLKGEVTALSVGSLHDLIALATSAPVITGVSPGSAPGTGGTQVTITGARLSEATAVYFGATAASSFEVLSPSEITVQLPPGEGVVEITIATPHGRSARSITDRFDYITAPAAQTGAANPIYAGYALLNATVNPDAAPLTECRFEWGTGPQFGSSAPCSSLSGWGTEPVPVSAEITGLEVDTTYHFRVMARNERGTGYGAEETFTTPASELPELGRCTKLPTATGRYSNNACTKSSRGEDSGSYEWLPGPGAAAAFTGSGGTVKVARSYSNKEKPERELTCTASSLNGAYQGAHYMQLTLTLTGCTIASGDPANSAGAASGEIVTQLQGPLASISSAGKSNTGYELSASTSEHRINYEVNVDGSKLKRSLAAVISGTVHATNKPARAFTLTFKASEVSIGEEPFKMTWNIANTEALEIKSKP